MEGDGLVTVQSKEDLPADVLRFFETQVDFLKRNFFPEPHGKFSYGGRCFKLDPLSFCEIDMDGGALVFFSSDGCVYYLFLGSYNYLNPEELP